MSSHWKVRQSCIECVIMKSQVVNLTSILSCKVLILSEHCKIKELKMNVHMLHSVLQEDRSAYQTYLMRIIEVGEFTAIQSRAQIKIQAVRFYSNKIPFV